MKKKNLKIFLIILIIIIIAWSLWGFFSSRVEQAQYTVIEKKASAE